MKHPLFTTRLLFRPNTHSVMSGLMCVCVCARVPVYHVIPLTIVDQHELRSSLQGSNVELLIPHTCVCVYVCVYMYVCVRARTRACYSLLIVIYSISILRFVFFFNVNYNPQIRLSVGFFLFWFLCPQFYYLVFKVITQWFLLCFYFTQCVIK